MPHTIGPNRILRQSSGNDSGGSDDNSSGSNSKPDRKLTSERPGLISVNSSSGQKQFVARSSHGHPKHFRNSSSTTRLNKMNRITPLHGLNEPSVTGKSPKSTAALITSTSGSGSTTNMKFLRSKSTDNIPLHHHEVLQRRATSQAMIRSSKSQTRISRHHHPHMHALMPTRSRDSSSSVSVSGSNGASGGKRKSTGTGAATAVSRPSQPVLELDHEDSDDDNEHEEEDDELVNAGRNGEEEKEAESRIESNIQLVADVIPKSQSASERLSNSRAGTSSLRNTEDSASSPNNRLQVPLTNSSAKSDEEYEDTDADIDDDKPPALKNQQSKIPPPSDSFKPLLNPMNVPTPPQISTETVVAISGTENSFVSPFLSRASHSRTNLNNSETQSATPEVVRSRFLDTTYGSGESTPYPVASWVDLQRFAASNNIPASVFDTINNNNGASPDLPHHNKTSSSSSTNPQHPNTSSSNANSTSSPVTTRTQQKLWLQRQSIGHPPLSTDTMFLTTDQRRDFERITKEFINVRRYQNPIAESIDRIRTLRQPPVSSSLPLQNRKKRPETNSADPYDSLSQSLPKRITSLSATTLNESNDFPTDETNINNTWKNVTTTTAASAANVGSVAYKLNKIWNEGWHDPDEPEQPVPQESPSIHSQAQQVQQQIAAAQRQLRPNGGIKLV